MLSIDRCTLYDSEIKLLILLPYVILKYLRMIALHRSLYIYLHVEWRKIKLISKYRIFVIFFFFFIPKITLDILYFLY